MSDDIWKLRADTLRGVTGVKYQMSQEKKHIKSAAGGERSSFMLLLSLRLRGDCGSRKWGMGLGFSVASVMQREACVTAENCKRCALGDFRRVEQ